MSDLWTKLCHIYQLLEWGKLKLLPFHRIFFSGRLEKRCDITLSLFDQCTIRRSKCLVFLSFSTTQRFTRTSGLVDTTNWQASHIEDDKASPNALLASSSIRIRTINTLTNQTTILFGSDQSGFHTYRHTDAEFRRITGFRQVDNVSILVVDSENHCIRLLNRTNGTTNPIAGRCTSAGFRDGNGTNSAFKLPHFIIDGKYKNEYYITDTDNNAIRTYDYSTGGVGTLVKKHHAIVQPKELVLNKNRTLIFVTVKDGIAKINITSGETLLYENFQIETHGITRLPHTDYLLVTEYSSMLVTEYRSTVTMITELGEYVLIVCYQRNLKGCQIRAITSIQFSQQLNALVMSSNNGLKRLDSSFKQGGKIE